MKERQLMLLCIPLFVIFSFCGFYINGLNRHVGWPYNMMGLLIFILSQKYIWIFHSFRENQDIELKIEYPNHELSVNEAIERHKELERQKREIVNGTSFGSGVSLGITKIL
ncbi:hypothetical protein [Kangiella shandongensis]|uniref:hypothetical protein n=1 Tax=Kangiella shandongensis TaxID=2763258 RepID=UPI001CBD3C06|nr:hypothetical protein [Kangiella shandongensis]